MAAAYAALVSLFNNLELIQNHPRHSFHFEDKQIQSLRQSVCFLIDFMQSCDYHGGSKEAAEDLERRIASAAHAAEDVVESHVVDQIHSGSTLGERKTCRFLLDLQKVIENMEFVSRKAMQVTKAHGGFKAEQPAHSVSSTPLFSEKSNNTMVGFDDVLHRLLDLLTRESSSREVIPIVGMGGAGKTTLARNAFEHKFIVQHFDVCLWATISQQYSVKEIRFQRKSAAGENETVYELEQLHRILWGRRYLVVLDDIWSMEAWDEIQLFLPSNDNKSRIVLTTRQSNVADCFGPSYLKMNPLDKDKSWNLFCEKAFAEKVCPPELEDIGKKIVKKCKGLPLAIVVVGGHLGKSSRMQEYWEKVANNFNSILDSGDENEPCLDILSLSYSYLPVQLKPCFIYMGTFDEDEEIDVSELIQLWVGEGFIKSNNNSEEVAEDYLKDLIERNLIIAAIKLAGKTYKCKIHDLLRELCLKIAEKEKFFHHVLSTPRAECRVLIVQDPEIIQAPISAPTVRSLKCQGADQFPFDLRLLRVQNRVVRALNNEVDVGFLERNLQHVNLRYLRCSNDDRDFKRYLSLRLPQSISRLWNLQTLIIEGVYEFVIAPYEIWEMPNLRHLVFNHIFLPNPHPGHSLDRPLGLRNVHRVVNFWLSEEVCKRIPDIKELSVTYYNIDEPMSHYSLHNLVRLHKLETLCCSFFFQGPELRDLALSLIFPSSLKLLVLTDPHLQWEELTMMVGFLPNLHILSLSKVKAGPEWNPIKGGFPNLKVLIINNCPDLICWNADSSHFPVLERLALEDFSKLDNFPSGLGEIPTLDYINLKGCSVSLAMSTMRMLVEQEQEEGNDGIRLHVDFHNDLEKQKSFEKQIEEEGLKSDNLVCMYISGYWTTIP